MKKFYSLFLFLLLPVAQGQAQQLWDGKIFDQGYDLEEPSSSAPAELAQMDYLIGAWDVQIRTATSDTTWNTAGGQSRITYMNRGHAIFEKFHCADFNGKGDEVNTISFLAYSAVNGTWNLGTANSYSESITIYDGARSGSGLHLTNYIRRNGGVVVTFNRLNIEKREGGGFVVRLEESKDRGNSWFLVQERVYSRRVDGGDFLQSESIFGSAAPDRPVESAEFDFLIGEWQAKQEITFPNGQVAKFPSNATAVYALKGHAVMEYNWYNVDPSLPEAATTIVRLYNRVMRRWENMYLTNRSNAILYFGGVRENEELVLHSFAADNSIGSFSYYIFHDMARDSYGWHAERSDDRGKTFKTTWTIEFTRKN